MFLAGNCTPQVTPNARLTTALSELSAWEPATAANIALSCARQPPTSSSNTATTAQAARWRRIAL